MSRSKKRDRIEADEAPVKKVESRPSRAVTEETKLATQRELRELLDTFNRNDERLKELIAEVENDLRILETFGGGWVPPGDITDFEAAVANIRRKMLQIETRARSGETESKSVAPALEGAATPASGVQAEATTVDTLPPGNFDDSRPSTETAPAPVAREAAPAPRKAEIAEGPREKLIIDITERDLLEIIGQNTLLKIAADLTDPDTAGRATLALRDIFTVAVLPDPAKKSKLSSKLASSGYSIEEFIGEWRKDNGLHKGPLDLLKKWVAETEVEVVNAEMGTLGRIAISLPDKAKVMAANILPVALGAAGVATALVFGGATVPVVIAASGGVGAFARAVMKKSKGLVEKLRGVSARAEASIKAKTEEKRKLILSRNEVKEKMRGEFGVGDEATAGGGRVAVQISEFLSQGLRMSSAIAISRESDRNRAGSKANELLHYAEAHQRIAKDAREAAVSGESGSELAKQAMDARARLLIAELHVVQDRKLIEEILKQDPNLLKALKKIQAFKDLDIDALMSVHDKRRPENEESWKKVAKVLLTTMAGVSVGAGLAAAPALRSVLWGLSGGYLGMKYGQYKSIKEKEQAFLKEVTNQIEDAEARLENYESEVLNSKEPEKVEADLSKLTHIATELRSPLSLGLFANNINLRVRTLNVLHRINMLEIREATKDMKAQALLDRMEKQVAELRAKRAEITSQITAVSKKKMIGWGIFGALTGAGLGFVSATIQESRAAERAAEEQAQAAAAQATAEHAQPASQSSAEAVVYHQAPDVPTPTEQSMETVTMGARVHGYERGIRSSWGSLSYLYDQHKNLFPGVDKHKWIEEQLERKIALTGPDGQVYDVTPYDIRGGGVIYHNVNTPEGASWELKVVDNRAIAEPKGLTLRSHALVEHRAQPLQQELEPKAAPLSRDEQLVRAYTGRGQDIPAVPLPGVRPELTSGAPIKVTFTHEEAGLEARWYPPAHRRVLSWAENHPHDPAALMVRDAFEQAQLKAGSLAGKHQLFDLCRKIWIEDAPPAQLAQDSGVRSLLGMVDAPHRAIGSGHGVVLDHGVIRGGGGGGGAVESIRWTTGPAVAKTLHTDVAVKAAAEAPVVAPAPDAPAVAAPPAADASGISAEKAIIYYPETPTGSSPGGQGGGRILESAKQAGAVPGGKSSVGKIAAEAGVVGALFAAAGGSAYAIRRREKARAAKNQSLEETATTPPSEAQSIPVPPELKVDKDEQWYGEGDGNFTIPGDIGVFNKDNCVLTHGDDTLVDLKKEFGLANGLRCESAHVGKLEPHKDSLLFYAAFSNIKIPEAMLALKLERQSNGKARVFATMRHGETIEHYDPVIIDTLNNRTIAHTMKMMIIRYRRTIEQESPPSG